MAVSPSASLATLRPDLAQSFEGFDLEGQQQGFIGMKVLPLTTVASQAGNYGIIPPTQMLIQHEDTRAPGSSYNRGQSTFKSLTYSCKEHGFEEAVDDREAKMYANYFDAESFAARRARDTVLRNTEARIIAQLADTTNNFTTGLGNTSAIGSTDLTTAGGGGVSWKTVATADPVTDVAKMSRKIWANSGLKPNTMVVSFNKFWDLRRNTNIQSQIKYSGLDDPKLGFGTASKIFAELFGVEEFLVAGALYATSNQAASALATSSLWSDGNVLLARCARTQDFKETCLGRIFHWEADGSSPNGTVESYRDESRRSNVIRVRMDTDEQVILPQAAYLATGADA